MSSTQITSIDVVVPCYNPIPNWEKNLVKCFKGLQHNCNAQLQLILVNDGSTKGIESYDIEFIEKSIPAFTFHSYPQNKGKGSALRTGVSLSNAEYCLITDVDFPYTNSSMLKVIDSLISNGGLITGHRKVDYYQKVPFFRRSLSKTFRFSLKLFLKIEVNDTQCGLRRIRITGQAIVF